MRSPFSFVPTSASALQEVSLIVATAFPRVLLISGCPLSVIATADCLLWANLADTSCLTTVLENASFLEILETFLEMVPCRHAEPY